MEAVEVSGEVVLPWKLPGKFPFEVSKECCISTNVHELPGISTTFHSLPLEVRGRFQEVASMGMSAASMEVLWTCTGIFHIGCGSLEVKAGFPSMEIVEVSMKVSMDFHGKKRKAEDRVDRPYMRATSLPSTEGSATSMGACSASIEASTTSSMETVGYFVEAVNASVEAVETFSLFRLGNLR